MLNRLVLAILRRSFIMHRLLPWPVYIAIIIRLRCYLRTGSFCRSNEWFES